MAPFIDQEFLQLSLLRSGKDDPFYGRYKTGGFDPDWRYKEDVPPAKTDPTAFLFHPKDMHLTRKNVKCMPSIPDSEIGRSKFVHFC